jgi:hypothetical protein
MLTMLTVLRQKRLMMRWRRTGRNRTRPAGT